MQIIVGGIIQQEDKILMIKEAKKKCYGKWNFPGGHLEDGETIFEGAIREIFEETGCKAELTNMLPIINDEFENDTFIMIIFLAKLLEERIEFNSEEILEVKWIKKEELQLMNNENLRDANLMHKILDFLEKGKIYPLDIINN